MNNYFVYIHICPNGKRYIGLTGRTPEIRWGVNGRGYKAHNLHFYNAILKYGWDNIEHNIIARGLSKDEACVLEKYLISKYKTTDRAYGYNKSTGGEMSGAGVKRTLSAETRRKISEVQKGKKMSAEAIRKRSEKARGQKRSKETRDKIAAATKIPIIQLDIYGNFIAEYESILSAFLITNIAKQNICKCCKGARNSAGGYKWRYKESGASHKKQKNN